MEYAGKCRKTNCAHKKSSRNRFSNEMTHGLYRIYEIYISYNPKIKTKGLHRNRNISVCYFRWRKKCYQNPKCSGQNYIINIVPWNSLQLTEMLKIRIKQYYTGITSALEE